MPLLSLRVNDNRRAVAGSPEPADELMLVAISNYGWSIISDDPTIIASLSHQRSSQQVPHRICEDE